MNWWILFIVIVVLIVCFFVFIIVQDAEDAEDSRANEDDNIADEVPGDNFPGDRR